MKAIMLVAGEGKRLAPYTKEKPKCMIDLDNKPIITFQLEIMKELGVQSVFLVGGYKKAHLNQLGKEIIVNQYYQRSNMVYSLWCARKVLSCDEPIIVSYGDIIYDNIVLASLIEEREDICVVIDLDWFSYWKARMDNVLEDAETLRIDENGYIIEIGKKPKSISEIQGQYIGLIKIQGKGKLKILEKMNEVLGVETEDTPFEKLKNVNFYLTDLLQALIDDGIRIKAVPIDGQWIEIDSANEFEKINDVFSSEKTVRQNRLTFIRSGSK